MGITYQIFKFNRVVLQSHVKHVETYRPILKSQQKLHLEKHPYDKNVQNNQFFRAMMVHERVNELIEEFAPDVLATEAGFANLRHVGAVIPLVSVNMGLMMSARELKYGSYEYAPKQVKKHFSGNGNADKDMMTVALQDAIDREQILLPSSLTVDTLSEHAVDSVAIGYTHVALNREGLCTELLKTK